MRDARLALILLPTLWACGDEAQLGGGPIPPPAAPAQLLALSTYSASVGTLVEVYGLNFPKPRQARLDLGFEGTFIDIHDRREPVGFVREARWLDGSTLRWTSFGPYRNPFSLTGAQVGRFEGQIALRIVNRDGSEAPSTPPLDVELEVTPSLIIHELQPVSASCQGGVVKALGGATYRMAVEAVGFVPQTFTYYVSAPDIDAESYAIRHVASGPRDTLEPSDGLVFPRVPESVSAYSARLTIEARARSGEVYRSAFVIGVHRPLEVFYNGNVQVAEVMAPEPVTACIPGGVNGRNASYTESEAEERSRGYVVNWNESWRRTHTVSSGSSETVGLTEVNGVGFATTDGRSFNWSLGSEVNGSFGIDKLVTVGVKANRSSGQDLSQSDTNSQDRSEGINESSTTTETEAVGESESGSQGGAFSWTVRSSEVISRGFGGRVIAGSYGVFYRQTLRLLRRAALVAYNQCGYAEVVGEVDFTDWTWSPDLALGNTCPPLPQSNLPTAECIVAPCQGE